MAKDYSTFNLFTQTLYDPKTLTIPLLLERYERLLKESQTFAHLMHSNRIHQYRKEITNAKYYAKIRKNVDSLYSLILRNYPELYFTIDGRIKSVISMDKKIVKNINTGKSLDLIRDTIGLRIIIMNNYSPQKLIELCYMIANSIISFNTTKNNLILCEAEPEVDVIKNQSNIPKIYIPKNSSINSEYSYGIKDYIFNPKQNGYQSLHMTFRLQSGECFEIQIRTFAMHLNAENGTASHLNYKKKKYNGEYIINPELVHILGYGITPNNTIVDSVGLQNGLLVYRRQKIY